MEHRLAALLPLLASLAAAQQVGTAIPEVHPKLPTQFCTREAGCVTRQTRLVTDALTRPFHAKDSMNVNCAEQYLTNKTLCPDAATCASNCVLEGVDYTTKGVLTDGTSMTLRMYVFNGTAFDKAEPRLYLLAEDGQNYEMMKLSNQELTYDVDMSALGCGMNGALFLSEMEASGSRSDVNPAGATYGTGYCDAQCFNTTSWINGLPNLNVSGSCCNEMDIWEANAMATAVTPHTCSGVGSYLCAGAECERNVGTCDKPGCGLNPYAFNARQFYGPGLTVDTSRPFTVITQFLSSDNTSAGELTEIRRMYIQDNQFIMNAEARVNATAQQPAIDTPGVITQDFCNARNASDFNRLGGMKGMGASLSRGMVLIFSLWNSEDDFMNWLDSDGDGPCTTLDGNPADIVQNTPETSVTFSNIRWGDIGTTFNSTGLAVVQPGVDFNGDSVDSERLLTDAQVAGVSGRGMIGWTAVVAVVLAGAVLV